MMVFGTRLMSGPRRWADVARTAEECGFESIWVPEHVVFPLEISLSPKTGHAEPSVSAATPAYDPWVQIAAMAAATERLRFGTFTFNIGLRHPFLTARSLTTIDALSGGRVSIGIGSSWLKEEWQALELDFESRGRRVNEAIEIVQRLLTEDVIEHDGEFFHFQPVGFLPKPVQKPWPPMFIGGDSQAAVRRAALLGDGWIPHMQTPKTLPANLQRLQQIRKEADRTGPFQITVMADDITTVGDVRRFEEAGVNRLVVTPFQNPRETNDAFRRFADEVISKIT
jgi:probable F420-dependent oxidoreductase